MRQLSQCVLRAVSVLVFILSLPALELEVNGGLADKWLGLPWGGFSISATIRDPTGRIYQKPGTSSLIIPRVYNGVYEVWASYSATGAILNDNFVWIELGEPSGSYGYGYDITTRAADPRGYPTRNYWSASTDPIAADASAATPMTSGRHYYVRIWSPYGLDPIPDMLPADPLDTPGSDDCPSADDVMIPGFSKIDLVRQTHIHDVIDYRAPNGIALTGTCGTCGTGGGPDQPGSRMPMFQWERIHRYRDLEYRSSFGPGVYANVDSQVILGTVGVPTTFPDGSAGPIISSPEFQVWSPKRTALVRLRPIYSAIAPYLVNGVLTGGRIELIGWKTLGDTLVDSVVITNKTASAFRCALIVQGAYDAYPSWDQATLNRVAITWREGGSEIFEAIAPHGTAVPTHGRLVRLQDAAGHGIDVAYTDSATSTLAALQNDPSRLWRIASITDGYGLTATPSYTYADGQWVISNLACPNGSSLQYTYGDGQLIGLNRVTLGDGSTGSFSTRYVSDSMQQEVIFNDPAGEGLHRRKSIFLTAAFAETATSPFTRIVPNLIRKVINGQGEMSFKLWITTDTVPISAGVNSPKQIWAYRGGSGNTSDPATSDGSKVVRIALQANGSPAQTDVVPSYNLSDPPETPLFKRVSTMDYNPVARSISKRTSGGGVAVAYQRDGSGRITGMISKRTDIANAPEVSRLFSFTPAGRPEVETDPIGRQTRRVWSTVNTGLLLSVTRGYGASGAGTWQWNYTPRGLVDTATDANGLVTNFGYNAAGYLTSITDPPDVAAGTRAIRTYQYDTAGRLVGTSYGGAGAVIFAYDARNRLISATYADGTSETTTYATSGPDVNMPIQRVDRAGNRTVLTYDANGRMASAKTYGPTDLAPVQTVLQTYVNGTDLVASRSVDGRTELYVYDENRRQVSTTIELTSGSAATATLKESVAYDADGRVTKRTDAYGRSTYAVYGSTGLLERQVSELLPGAVTVGADLAALPRITTANPPYRITDTSYDLAGQIIAITDANGVVERRGYDGQARPSQIIRADTRNGVALTEATREDYEYDPQGNLTTIWRPRSFVRSGATFTPAATPVKTVFTYTGRNRVRSMTQATGTADAATVNYTYTLPGQVETISDPRNPAWLTTYRYSPCCSRVREIEDAQHFLTTYSYDGNGRLLTMLDPSGVGYTRTYDAVGRLLTETTTGQQTVRFAYDPSGSTQAAQNLLRMVDPTLLHNNRISMVTATWADGTVSRTIRDAIGRDLVVQGADGGIASWSYDQLVSGLVQVSSTDPAGATTTAAYDASGNARWITNAVDGQSQFGYDAVGNVLSSRDPNAVGSDLQYDGLNRPTRIADTANAVRTFAYDAHGNVTRLYDPTNAYDEITYNLRDLPTKQRNRRAKLVQIGYDKRGNRTSLTDEQSRVTSWIYDSLSHLTQVTYPAPAGGTVAMTYDPAGRLKTRTDQAGVVTTLVYDLGGRVGTRQYSDAASDTFAYDAQGRLASAANGRFGVATAWTFGTDGRLASETQSMDGESWTLRYAYDRAGRLITRTLPDGDVESRTYTALGLPREVSLDGQLIAQRGYDTAGRRIATQRGNGLTETWNYKPNDDLVASVVENGVSNLSYNYNSRKLPTTVTDARTATNNQTFTVDAQDRLTGWTRGSPAADTWSWTLSDAGDWTSLTTNGTATARTHNEVHATTAIGANTLTSDARGNLTTDAAGRSFTWDSQNRLLTATVAGQSTGFRYDALGRRVAMDQGALRTVYAQTSSQTVWSERLNPAARAAWKPPTAATPQGQPALPTGAILDLPGTERITWQPATSATPDGWRGDSGAGTAARSGLTYGWRGSEQFTGVDRNWLGWPIYDTYLRLAPADGTRGTWEVLLPNGSYPVVIVCGDARSHMQTNHLVVNGQAVRDPSPYNAETNYGYTLGDFDGYAQVVTVTNGRLEIRAAGDAVDPKLCFIEIGPLGGQLTAEAISRVAQYTAQATAQTETGRPGDIVPDRIARLHGAYVDDRLAERRTHGEQDDTYHLHTDRRYSLTAVTDSTGLLVERYRYSPYGERTVLAGDGVTVRPNSFISAEGSFTGYPQHGDLGLMYARNRWYSPSMGRFVNRDPAEYVDGTNLYSGYFALDALDPDGLSRCAENMAGMLETTARLMQLQSLLGQCPGSEGIQWAIQDLAQARAGMAAEFGQENCYGQELNQIELSMYRQNARIVLDAMDNPYTSWIPGFGQMAGRIGGYGRDALDLADGDYMVALNHMPMRIPGSGPGGSVPGRSGHMDMPGPEMNMAAKSGAPAQLVDLTDFRSVHILNRHRAGAGISGKTEFPKTWSDQQILHHASDVATDPKAVTGMGKWDSPYAIGVRDGIEIRVDFFPTTHSTHAGKISTAYPTNVAPNP